MRTLESTKFNFKTYIEDLINNREITHIEIKGSRRNLSDIKLYDDVIKYESYDMYTGLKGKSEVNVGFINYSNILNVEVNINYQLKGNVLKIK